MTKLLIRGGRVLRPEGWAEPADVCVADGLVDRVGDGLAPAGAEVIDARGLIVTPGFIDVHVHGAAASMFEEADPEAVLRISSTLARFGVTGFLATLSTLPPERLRDAVDAIAGVVGSEPGARILGIHLEGPYLSPLRAGAQAVPWMRPPSVEEFDALCERSGGNVRLVTVAPELEGAIPFIAAARQRGVTVSAGHSNATEQEMLLAIQAGAAHVTHLFNALRELHHREPGVLGVGLTDDGVSVELVCDGHHLAPRIVDLALRCKPRGKVVFVSDAVGALGMPDGEYEMFGTRCVIGGGAVRLLHGGNLAGSCLSLDRAVRNVHAWLPGVPLELLLEAASANPAAVIGADNVGRIIEGADADLVLLEAGLEVVATIVHGRVVWRR